MIFATPVSQLVSYDIGVVDDLLRHCDTFAAHALDRPGTTRVVLAWCRAINEAIMNPRRPSTRRDAWYPRAPTEYSDRCRV